MKIPYELFSTKIQKYGNKKRLRQINGETFFVFSINRCKPKA